MSEDWAYKLEDMSQLVRYLAEEDACIGLANPQAGAVLEFTTTRVPELWTI